MKRRVLRWCVRTAVVLGVLASAGVVFVVWIVGEVGESATERWVGQRLRSLTNERLNARLGFDQLDYQYPDTIVVDRLRLTVSGPVGRRVDIVTCERATLALAERPRKDRPLRVRLATLERPALRLMRHPAAGLVGFRDLVKKPGGPGPGHDQTLTGEVKTFGQLFAFERVEMSGGRLTYDAGDDTPTLELDGITAASDLNRTDADVLDATLEITRPETLDVRLAGRLRTDAGRVEDATATAWLDLSTDATRSLPPVLQALLQRYEVRGHLDLNGQGAVDFAALGGSAVDATLSLRDGGFAWAGLVYPLSDFDARLELRDGVAMLTEADGDLLGGVVSLRGRVGLVTPYAAKASVSVDAVRLEAREASVPESGDQSTTAVPLLTGAVTGRITWDGPLAEPDAATGKGNLRITEARLARLPLVSRFLDTLSVVPVAGSMARDRDTAEAVFRIENGGATVEAAYLAVDAIGIKTTGRVGLDGTLDLVARAGPLERIEQRLGRIGKMLSASLSFLPRYRVTGTLRQPSIALAPPTASVPEP